MKLTKTFYVGAVILAAAMSNVTVSAAESIDADDFVEEASAKGLAEIETSKMALKKATSTSVKTFAQTMIDDHTQANKELATLAQKKQLEVADDPELMNKAKALVLKQRDGESFDQAYAKNQVSAHEQTIELFEQAAQSDDAEIKAFAQKTLPKLEHHLEMAKELAAETGAAKNSNKGNSGAAATSSKRSYGASSTNDNSGTRSSLGADGTISSGTSGAKTTGSTTGSSNTGTTGSSNRSTSGLSSSSSSSSSSTSSSSSSSSGELETSDDTDIDSQSGDY